MLPAVFTLVVPLLTGLVVFIDPSGLFASPLISIAQQTVELSNTLCAYGLLNNDTVSSIDRAALGNTLRYVLTGLVLYIAIPCHVGVSEYRARVLFHIQNLLRKETLGLAQSPAWKPVATSLSGSTHTGSAASAASSALFSPFSGRFSASSSSSSSSSSSHSSARVIVRTEGASAAAAAAAEPTTANHSAPAILVTLPGHRHQPGGSRRFFLGDASGARSDNDEEEYTLSQWWSPAGETALWSSVGEPAGLPMSVAPQSSFRGGGGGRARPLATTAQQMEQQQQLLLLRQTRRVVHLHEELEAATSAVELRKGMRSWRAASVVQRADGAGSVVRVRARVRHPWCRGLHAEVAVLAAGGVAAVVVCLACSRALSSPHTVGSAYACVWMVIGQQALPWTARQLSSRALQAVMARGASLQHANVIAFFGLSLASRVGTSCRRAPLSLDRCVSVWLLCSGGCGSVGALQWFAFAVVVLCCQLPAPALADAVWRYECSARCSGHCYVVMAWPPVAATYSPPCAVMTRASCAGWGGAKCQLVCDPLQRRQRPRRQRLRRRRQRRRRQRRPPAPP